jgi:hypothetical protein
LATTRTTRTAARPTLSLGSARPVVGRLSLSAALDQEVHASVVLAGGLEPPAAGQKATLQVGDLSFADLEVADFDLPADGRGGGLVRLVGPVGRAPPYRLEVFSGRQGASFGDALAGRVRPLYGPPELFGVKFPAVVVEGSAASLLDDVCVRHGWHWHRSRRGLEIGPLKPTAAVPLEGVEPHWTPAGLRLRVTSSPWPSPGSAARTKWGGGIVLETVLDYAPGAGVSCVAVVGQPPLPPRSCPRGSVRWRGVVRQLDPLLIAATDEDGRAFVTRGQLMARVSDRGAFRESLPVQSGDPVLIEVPAGGVSVAAPLVFQWADSSPTSTYQVASRSRDDIIETAWRLEVKEITQSAESVRIMANRVEARVHEIRIDEK